MTWWKERKTAIPRQDVDIRVRLVLEEYDVGGEAEMGGPAYGNMTVQLLTLGTIPQNVRRVVNNKPKLKRLQRHGKEGENLASLNPTQSHWSPGINYSQRSMSARVVLVSHLSCLWGVGVSLWIRFFPKPLSFHVLCCIFCQPKTEDVSKMTVLLQKSDSVKRNSLISAKPRRQLIYTIKRTARECKKWHCSAQKLLASVNKTLGCCWWLAVFQNLTKF